MKVSITGGKDLEAAFAQLKDGATKRRTGTRALQKAAEIIRDRAKELAPDDLETGANNYLRASIKIGRAAGAMQRQNNSGSVVTTFVGIDGSVLPSKPSTKRLTKKGTGKPGGGVAVYSIMVENGTASHAAKPFMRPAWEQTKDSALKAIVEITRVEIDKTAARAARKAAK